HHAPDGVDLDALDRALHRRADLGPGEGLGARDEGLVGLRELGLDLREIRGRVGAELVASVGRLEREVVALALEAQQLHLRDQAASHHRLGDRDLAIEQGDAAIEAREALLERAHARLVHVGLAAEDLGMRPDLVGKFELAPVRLGAQPGGGCGERDRLGLELAVDRLGARRVDAQQQLALLDHVALANQELGEDAGIEALDHLLLAGRHDATLAARDLLELGPGRPEDEAAERQQHERHCQEGEPGAFAVFEGGGAHTAATLAAGIVIPRCSACIAWSRGASRMMLPASMTMTRSTISMICGRWVTMTRVRGRSPLEAQRARDCRTCFSVLGSRPLLGSSRSAMAGSRSARRASVTSRFWPPE